MIFCDFFAVNVRGEDGAVVKESKLPYLLVVFETLGDVQ